MSIKSRIKTKFGKGERYNAASNVDTLIERMKKIRALNGDPALFGIDSYVIKRPHFNDCVNEILVDFWKRV